MDKERSIDFWANEGGKRIEFVALANGDVKINFNTSDGQTYESLTLASYRYDSVVTAIGKFRTLIRERRDIAVSKGNTMNYKEKIEEMMGDLLGLETQAFTTGAVTQQYVKWDDLFTLLFDTGEQITSLIEQAQRDAVEGLLPCVCDMCRDLLYSKYAIQKQGKEKGGVEKLVREEQEG